jgi:Mg2+ and Co2+ transporter CorA
MATTTAETANIVKDVLDPREFTGDHSLAAQLFQGVPQPSLRSLFARARQTESYRRDIEGELDTALQRCDQLREEAQITATHRVTAYGALILVPSLLFDFFGQAFIDLPAWLQRWGWWLTLGVTVAYWLVHIQILRRRRYL